MAVLQRNAVWHIRHSPRNRYRLVEQPMDVLMVGTSYFCHRYHGYMIHPRIVVVVLRRFDPSRGGCYGYPMGKDGQGCRG